ncbi:MAG TPA: lysylphosphatidylglycerol synthase transmembrane domain-containing protein [Candidatus Eisenbacteria bacterium]|nr:lysylphosphatidylglycerol synthase transmembrane domain-containing protein [Candidatus Eisenbacteria bacterium]
MNRAVKLLLGVVVSALCVWLSMREVNPREVFEVLRHSNGVLFAALMGLTLLGFWIRAVRWKSFMAARQAPRLPSLYSATMIGFMANNVLPFRLGEFVRAWALARRERLSNTMVLATVVVERVVDMLTLLGIMGLTLFLHPVSAGSGWGKLVHGVGPLLIGASAAITLALVLLERKPARARALVAQLSSRLPERHRRKGVAALDHFVAGLSLFRDVPRLVWVFVLSFLMFGVFALGLQASAEALQLHLPWHAGLTLLVVTAIAIMVPAAPGYIGTMTGAYVIGLELFGVHDKALANSVSWFYWAGQWLPVTVVGLWFLHREGLSLRALGQAQEHAA